MIERERQRQRDRDRETEREREREIERDRDRDRDTHCLFYETIGNKMSVILLALIIFKLNFSLKRCFEIATEGSRMPRCFPVNAPWPQSRHLASRHEGARNAAMNKKRNGRAFNRMMNSELTRQA